PVVCVLGDYSITQSTGAAIVPGTTYVPNSACNDCTAPLVLPFPVQFYDQTFTQARASSNGNLQFTSDNSLPFNSCLPNPQYNNTIYGYWDDLFLDCLSGWGCGIYTSTSGSAPNRIFNIEWRAHRNEPPIVNVKFEIRLYENGNGRFDIIYGQLDNPGNTATVGVQRDTGSRSTQFSCDTGVLTQGLQLTFTLPPCSTATPFVNSPTPTLSPTATPTSPTLLYSTYYGSFERDSIEDIARDAAGNIYVMGTTFQNDINYGDIYVSKFSPNGQSVLYQTILGGTRIDYGYALSVDAAGNATVAGIATSNDYPLLNPVQATHGGGIYDVVLTKLNPTGNTLFSTYLGGNGTDYAGRLATDGAGNVFLTGYTSSTNFPVTAGAYQTTNHGSSDGFVTKISPNGSAIVWSTYLGGIYAEQSNDITLDGAGNIYLTGFTGSPDFPTVNPFQDTLFDGDAFVTKMNPSGTALIFSTFLGGDNPPGPGEDNGQGIALDEQGYIYVTGFTQSPNFPTTPGSFQPFFNGYYDAFVTKFTPAGNSLVYSTFIGGTLEPPYGDDEAFDIAVDGAGQAHITGRTNSPDFPTVRAVQPTKQDVNDAFVTKLNASGSDLIYSTFLGGDYAPPEFTGDDSGSAILIDLAGNAVIGGGTGSGNFPVANAYQPSSAGESDGFISKISGSNPLSTPTPTNTVLQTATRTATIAPTQTPGGPSATTAPTSVPTNTQMPTGTRTNTVIPPSSTPRPPTQTPGGPTATIEPTSTAVPTSTVCAISFSDVPSDSTFYTWIRCLACRGIISGYTDGTFRPGNDITRGQIAKVVSNSAGFSEDPGPQLYEDVPVGSPFYAWINRLSMRGHMGGYPCGLVPEEPCEPPNNRPYFRPNASATRGQLAKIVSNAAVLGGDPTGLFYADVPEDHPFYVWIMRLTTLSVMSGYPCGGENEPCDDQQRPYFRPYNNVTRGQASKIVANTFFPNCQTAPGR
ncbi:MAG TPA: SBBP repeat-containing protein, partial [Chloroflexia bacterium]|nr:SBBP repeat-containing protein [Chloroflexia bacterium]